LSHGERGGAALRMPVWLKMFTALSTKNLPAVPKRREMQLRIR